MKKLLVLLSIISLLITSTACGSEIMMVKYKRICGGR